MHASTNTLHAVTSDLHPAHSVFSILQIPSNSPPTSPGQGAGAGHPLHQLQHCPVTLLVPGLRQTYQRYLAMGGTNISQAPLSNETSLECLAPGGEPLCNACYQYQKRTGRPRPLNLRSVLQGVPQYWLHFVFFVIFWGSGARTEELLTFFQQPWKFAT